MKRNKARLVNALFKKAQSGYRAKEKKDSAQGLTVAMRVMASRVSFWTMEVPVKRAAKVSNRMKREGMGWWRVPSRVLCEVQT